MKQMFTTENVLIAILLLIGSEILKKIIKDNLPSYYYKDVIARAKIRIKKVKFLYEIISLGWLALLTYWILKLSTAGLIKLNKNTALIMTVFLIICLVLKKSKFDFKKKPILLLPSGTA